MSDPARGKLLIKIKKMAMRKTEVLLVVNLLMDGWSG